MQIKDNALVEYATADSDKDIFVSKYFNYSELKKEQRRQASEATFSEAESYGCNDLMDALKRGYSAIGCEYGENKLGKLKTTNVIALKNMA